MLHGGSWPSHLKTRRFLKRARLNNKVAEITKTVLIAELYVVLTFAFTPLSYIPIQFRLSELLNTMVVFNKRYMRGVWLLIYSHQWGRNVIGSRTRITSGQWSFVLDDIFDSRHWWICCGFNWRHCCVADQWKSWSKPVKVSVVCK